MYNHITKCTSINAQLYRYLFFSHGATAPSGPGLFHYGVFTVTLRHTTLGRTLLDERSARCRVPYLTTNNTHRRQTSTPRRDSNPQSQQAARPLRSASLSIRALMRNNIATYAIINMYSYRHQYKYYCIITRLSIQVWMFEMKNTYYQLHRLAFSIHSHTASGEITRLSARYSTDLSL
jgi:hypothetical protein